MKETIEAIYENGLLRPLRKLRIHEGQRILLTVEKDEKQPAVVCEAGKTKRYDFSDLIGKLSWQGDPVAEQRALRDEQ